MDYLKEGSGLRAMAQRDPLVEYQREGYDMFMAMLEGLKEESVGFLFNVQVEAAPRPAVAPVEAPQGLSNLPDGQQEQSTLRAKGIEDDDSRPMSYSGPSEDGSAAVQQFGRRSSARGGATRKERREAARQDAREKKSLRRG
jgi:preprotein translocase subunit SecA